MVDILNRPIEPETNATEAELGSIVDPTTTFSATPTLLEFIEGVPQLHDLRKSLSENPVLDIDALEKLRETVRPKTMKLLTGEALDAALDEAIAKGEPIDVPSDGVYLHELLQGSRLNLPENPPITRSPELQARLDKLRYEQAEVAYQAMTKNVSPGKFRKEDTVAYQMDMMNRHLIAVGQLILSVGAGFAFGFFGVPLAVGGMEFGVRVLLGMLAAVIIAIAELYFLGKYMVAEDEMQDGKKKKE